jgi:2-hydroxy-3-keto-5-methylthiopentenyl-1-phosphate phosphatase
MSSHQNLEAKIVFCDFDGTITAVETFVGMLKEFAPEMSAQVMPELYARKLSLREGVRQMLESIPSARYPDIISYAKDQPIRPGLPELLDFLELKQIPFVIISGGIKNMIIDCLKHHNLLTRVKAVVGMDLDSSQEYLRVNSAFESESELVAKVQVMATYPTKKSIAIGDSITDLNMALNADLVFARDRLIEYLKAENKPYITWENFFDIRDYLASMITD